MSPPALARVYEDRLDTVLTPLAVNLQALVRDHFHGAERIDRISARAKSVARFMDKAAKRVDGQAKYTEPLSDIQDQVGVRIITFYLDDVPRLSKTVLRYFTPIEQRHVVPDSEREFDYVGEHFILFVPSDVLADEWPPEKCPKVFELQIKTLFQHAWSEANHDLGYKPNAPLSRDQKRRIAFTSAQAWGADHVFDELHRETADSAVVVR